MKSEQFCLAFQPIVRISQKDNVIFEELEVLLRSMAHQKFPAEKFYEILSDEQQYNQYIEWFTATLESKIIEYPDIRFSINLDIDQFQFEATYQFLHYFSKYHRNIIIEITEHTPKNDPELLGRLGDILKKIKLYNFKIAIDDYTTGINTFLLYKKHRVHYDRVKITFAGYRSMFSILGLVIYVNLMEFFFAKKIDIVVEKIDSLRKSKIISKLPISHQQGYYFGVGHSQINNTPNDV